VTTTYDPHHPKYLDDVDLRDELSRVFDLCHGCQRCVQLCSAFPTMFEQIDRRDHQDAATLTRAEQDQVVDECFQCKRCYLNCPYVPGQSDWALDFPRLMLRAGATRHASGEATRRSSFTTNVLAHTDLVGRLGTNAAGLANAVTAKPGSLMRKAMEAVTGVSSVRLLPPFTRQRFSTWFKNRPRVRAARPQGRVAVYPTCLVEYQNPAVGQDLVKVYERNGVECSLAGEISCCGAPWLHSGDIDKFMKVAMKNVRALAATVRAGHDIVVPQPTCGYVLRRDYLDYVGGPNADVVASHTYDAAEYLMRIHKAPGTALDTEFRGDVPDVIVYHAPCHLRAQQIGIKSRDLMRLTGARIKVVQQCAGIDGLWGFRSEHVAHSLPLSRQLGDEIERVGGDLVAGDCHLANTAITEQTGRIPLHPMQVIARAYGIGPEPTL